MWSGKQSLDKKRKKIAAASFFIPSVSPQLTNPPLLPRFPISISQRRLIIPSVCTVGTCLPLIALLVVPFPQCEQYTGGVERRVVHVCRCCAWRHTPPRSFVRHTEQGHAVSCCEIMQRGRLEEASVFSFWLLLTLLFVSNANRHCDKKPIAVCVPHILHHQGVLTHNRSPVVSLTCSL